MNKAPTEISHELLAGPFSAWLQILRHALQTGSGIDVQCGDCTACCTSSYFIHISPVETHCMKHINKNLLVAAPGLATGHFVIGYDKKGVCPLMTSGKCSIYKDRPLTCRNYDCRVFAAAGITAGGIDKVRINRQIERWTFTYPYEADYKEHFAVKSAAQFISTHEECFPEGKVSRNPSQLAILAIKVYHVFLDCDETVRALSTGEIANAIVRASHQFDLGINGPGINFELP